MIDMTADMFGSFTQIDYSIRCMFPKWSDWNIQYTTKGLIKHRVSQTIKAMALIAVIVGAYYIRKDVRGGLYAVQSFIRQNLKTSLLGLLGFIQNGISKLPG